MRETFKSQTPVFPRLQPRLAIDRSFPFAMLEARWNRLSQMHIKLAGYMQSRIPASFRHFQILTREPTLAEVHQNRLRLASGSLPFIQGVFLFFESAVSSFSPFIFPSSTNQIFYAYSRLSTLRLAK